MEKVLRLHKNDKRLNNGKLLGDLFEWRKFLQRTCILAQIEGVASRNEVTKSYSRKAGLSVNRSRQTCAANIKTCSFFLVLIGFVNNLSCC